MKCYATIEKYMNTRNTGRVKRPQAVDKDKKGSHKPEHGYGRIAKL